MLSELEAAQGLLKYLHHHIKDELKGLDEEGLNWVPAGSETVNSVYGLALHIASTQVAFASALIKERIKLEIPELADNTNSRANISAVLKIHGTSQERATTLLRQAAEITNQVFEKVTIEHLEAEATLPGGGKGTGHSWVQLMLMHTGEHLGHMSLTRQLYENRSIPA